MIATLLLALPLFSALLILFFFRSGEHSGKIASWLATASALICLILSLVFLRSPDALQPVYEWMKLGDFSLSIELLVDRLSRGMMFIVCLVGALVHLFSLVYMDKDPAKARYFGGLCLFLFSMTGIVLAGNFLMMFIFWELVGVSSWMLIGHWFEKDSAAKAANKAFIANRIGDFGFLIGILILFGLTGTVSFAGIESTLEHSIVTGPLLGIALLCIFCGAIGKSAQFPLHVWLPDAMEGPTPISALIHAATMVAAGVYMLARSHFLIEAASSAELQFFGLSFTAPAVIALVGGLTALLAALIATQQDDIKKILAYSTLSQLGYMVMACGLHSTDSAMFHLYTHAFFKALLFLGAGAVIYACHHKQNIWEMGGLLRRMPITSICFFCGWAALIAVPLLSGACSKECILSAAAHHNKFYYFLGLGVAFLTAFYMTRLVTIAFLGRHRSSVSEDAIEVPPLMWVPLTILAVLALFSAYLGKPLQAMIPHDFSFNPFAHGWVTPLLSLLATAGGAFLAYSRYIKANEEPKRLALFENKFYFDELYGKLVSAGQDRLAWMVKGLDETLIGGVAVNGLGNLSRGASFLIRRLQSGNLQHYNLGFVGGVFLLIYLLVYIF